MENTFHGYTATEVVSIMNRFQRLKDAISEQYPLVTMEKAKHIVERLNAEFTERELQIIATQTMLKQQKL